MNPFSKKHFFRFFLYPAGTSILIMLIISFSGKSAAAEDNSTETTSITTTSINFALRSAWASLAGPQTYSVSWGDMDGDGDLDLAVGNAYQIIGNSEPSKVYRNDGGVIQNTPVWASPTNDQTHSIAWGDMDGDGDLDLALGNLYSGLNTRNSPSKVYRNDGGVIQNTPIWTSPTKDATTSIAWGDMDGDGDLDLAFGNSRQPSKVYRNEAGMLQNTPAWISLADDDTTSIAWGDMDGDGDLDLALGNGSRPSKVYRNDGGIIQNTPIWTSPTQDATTSIAWGDMDGDGDLDLAFGNSRQPSKVYRNEAGMLQNTPAWISLTSDSTMSVAWGDGDGDGDLDLALGNNSEPSKVYRNEEGVLQDTPSWASPTSELTKSIAWGDMDGDGDLDLALGNVARPSKVYQNEAAMLQDTPAWSSPTSDSTMSVAWGDMDGDGDLDLALGNRSQPSKVYRNEGGMLQNTPAWSSPTSDSTQSVAWGDVDNDGDLDLALGNSSQPSKVYRNEEGMLQDTPVWTSPFPEDTYSIAWGDMDDDGDLDLVRNIIPAIINYKRSNKVYRNEGGVIRNNPVWTSPTNDMTLSIAWGDMDGDGDLDLAFGNAGQPSGVYRNEGGVLQNTPTWTSPTSNPTTSVVWGDVDGDGDLDLIFGNYDQPSEVYRNQAGTLTDALLWSAPISDTTTSIAWGDVDNDGAIDLALGNNGKPSKVYLNKRRFHGLYARPTGVQLNLVNESTQQTDGLSDFIPQAYLYATSSIFQSGSISFTYQLFHPTSEPIRAIRVYYSLSGSFPADRATWREVKPRQGTKTSDLSSSPYPTATITNTHTFAWDVFNSGFFGQSDNVVIRIEALPNLKPVPNGVPGPFDRPYLSDQTLPFRVRGNQVRVVQAGNSALPLQDARVYHLLADQIKDGLPYTALDGTPYRTDSQGYLQGRGNLSLGDKLVAFLPLTSTATYTIYATSAAVNNTGLDTKYVTQVGVQTLTVSSENKLILFDLTVSLEWDARNDPSFMAQLQNDIKRTSQLLFDLSNGQAALGNVRIYHDKGFWGTADVVITANNIQRPNAIMGGSVLTPTADIDRTGIPIPDAYVPGQVRIGATWSRFGDAGGTLGEDWPRALAHELSHYFFFLADDYVGVTTDHKFVKLVDCKGSVMTDPYDESYSEFLNTPGWTGECLNTMMQEYLGRTDWQTIKRFYPMLNENRLNPGPSQLPLAVTQIETFAPPTATTTLASPFFNLVNAVGETVSIPNGQAQAYLFKTQNDNDPTNNYVIELGTPIGDQVQARGAAPGDRLCVFAYDQTPLRLGCLESIGNTPSPVTLYDVSNWQPQIQVRGITTNTVIVTVTNLSEANLSLQLLPALGVASNEIAMTKQGNSFVKQITAVDGAYYGYVRIWVPGSNPHKELLVQYIAVEAWDARSRAWGTNTDAWGARSRAWGIPAYSWGARARAWGAPTMSNDGQVSIFPLVNPFAPGQRYILQTLAFPPSLPSWLSLVGRAYQIDSSNSISNSAILFSYLARDVPAGYEDGLHVYYLSNKSQQWQRLETELDVYRNQASAPLMGDGIYLLAATDRVQSLTSGWNLAGYTVQISQPVTLALASLAGSYNIVYTYDPLAANPEQIFDPNVQPSFSALVNTLQWMEHGHGYWIYATKPVTWYLGVSSASETSNKLIFADSQDIPAAPAVYYGWITPTSGFTPTVGMPVIAEINGVACGETQIQKIDGQLAYVINVRAGDLNTQEPTCGVIGQAVIFQIGEWTISEPYVWDNRQTWFQPLTTATNTIALPQQQLFLPLVQR